MWPIDRDGQSIRTVCAADGAFTWVFPKPYPVGVIPVITAIAEATGPMSITAVSNVSVAVKLTELAGVTVLGINVLAAGASQSRNIHLTASTP